MSIYLHIYFLDIARQTAEPNLIFKVQIKF